MIRNDLVLLLALGALAAGIQAAAGLPRLRGIFRRLPAPFWCYFLPAVLAAAGVLPSVSIAYAFAGYALLPFCLALLLINVDLKALRSLGRPGLLAIACAGFGIVAGAVVAYTAVGAFLPPEAWKAVGALAGSWTGGSINMVAVKEAIGAPASVFAPAIVVDTVFAYGWMAFLIWLAARQGPMNRWLGADAAAVETTLNPAGGPALSRAWPWPLVPVGALALAAGAIAFGRGAGPSLTAGLSRLSPALGSGFSSTTWTILAVTTAALGLSFTGRFAARPERTERLGNLFLYFLLTTLGAQASLRAVGESPAFLLLGALWLAVHGGVLLLGARLFRLPLGLAATASQSCLGGVVSGPMVGAVYHPALAVAGLLMAVLGNVAGTYIGLATAGLCGWIGGGS